MCLPKPKTKTATAPAPPPPPPSDEKAQTPVIEESFNGGDVISTKRRGVGALRIPLGGLSIPG